MRIEEWTAIGPRSAAWDSLVEAMELPSPFLRAWWVDNTVPDDARVIVAISEGSELLGGLALQRSSTLGVETFKVAGGGALEPDHVDVVAAPSDRARVTAAVGDWMSRRGSRMFDLDGVADGSLLVGTVPGFGDVTSRDVAPHAALPRSSEEYLAARPGKVRSTITRTSKRFDREGITFERVPASGAAEALANLENLHDDRWGEDSGMGAVWPLLTRAAAAGVSAGDVWISQLTTADGTPIATEIEFVVAGRASFYQAGRLTDHEYRGSGSVLRFRIVAAAIESGCHEFDLLRGDEPYKTEWATDTRRLVRIRRGVGVGGRAVVMAARANMAVGEWRARRATDGDAT